MDIGYRESSVLADIPIGLGNLVLALENMDLGALSLVDHTSSSIFDWTRESK